jgi:hypothetical protein
VAGEGSRISVEAPSALLGFLLVLRLQDVKADVVRMDDGRWAVALPPDTPRERVLLSVQAWLDDETLDETVVRFGDDVVMLAAPATAGASL